MSSIPTEESEGVPEFYPTKSPDDELRLTDDGLEMPEVLKGHVGSFTIRTPSATAELETTEAGLPDTEFYDGIFATHPDAGEYHGDLREGLMAVSVPGMPETVYEIIDERSDEVSESDE